MNLLAQIFGFLALSCIVFSYQQIKRKKFIVIQGISNIFYTIQYILLNAYSAVGSCVISILRTIIVYYFERKNKKMPLLLIVFIEILIIIIGMYTYKNIYSLIPILIVFLYTYGVCQKQLTITYFIGIIAGLLWIVYNYIVGAYISIIGSVFEFISALLGLIKVIKYGNKQRRNNKKSIKKRR